jgi:hypothetical protein
VIRPARRALGRRYGTLGRVPARAPRPSSAGPAAGGRICGSTLETREVGRKPSQPVPREPISPASPSLDGYVGAVRLPLGGPYCPKARLFVAPDGRTRWIVHLWVVDHVVRRELTTEEVRAFARRNGLRVLEAQIDCLLELAAPGGRP